MDSRLGYQDIAPKTGDESFVDGGRELGPTVTDFWRWADSDLLANTTRGVVAEYLVMLAVGASEAVRDPWARVDVSTPEGVTLEVKSTCEVQSWAQKSPSRLEFRIKPTTWWHPKTGKTAEPASRHSDLWVFCVLRTPSDAAPDPMDVAGWDFYVLPTAVLDKHRPRGQSVALSTIVAWGAQAVSWHALAAAVRATSA